MQRFEDAVAARCALLVLRQPRGQSHRSLRAASALAASIAASAAHAQVPAQTAPPGIPQTARDQAPNTQNGNTASNSENVTVKAQQRLLREKNSPSAVTELGGGSDRPGRCAGKRRDASASGTIGLCLPAGHRRERAGPDRSRSARSGDGADPRRRSNAGPAERRQRQLSSEPSGWSLQPGPDQRGFDLSRRRLSRQEHLRHDRRHHRLHQPQAEQRRPRRPVRFGRFIRNLGRGLRPQLGSHGRSSRHRRRRAEDDAKILQPADQRVH